MSDDTSPCSEATSMITRVGTSMERRSSGDVLQGDVNICEGDYDSDYSIGALGESDDEFDVFEDDSSVASEFEGLVIEGRQMKLEEAESEADLTGCEINRIFTNPIFKKKRSGTPYVAQSPLDQSDDDIDTLIREEMYEMERENNIPIENRSSTRAPLLNRTGPQIRSAPNNKEKRLSKSVKTDTENGRINNLLSDRRNSTFETQEKVGEHMGGESLKKTKSIKMEPVNTMHENAKSKMMILKPDTSPSITPRKCKIVKKATFENLPPRKPIFNGNMIQPTFHPPRSQTPCFSRRKLPPIETRKPINISSTFDEDINRGIETKSAVDWSSPTMGGGVRLVNNQSDSMIKPSIVPSPMMTEPAAEHSETDSFDTTESRSVSSSNEKCSYLSTSKIDDEFKNMSWTFAPSYQAHSILSTSYQQQLSSPSWKPSESSSEGKVGVLRGLRKRLSRFRNFLVGRLDDIRSISPLH